MVFDKRFIVSWNLRDLKSDRVCVSRLPVSTGYVLRALKDKSIVLAGIGWP